MSVARDEVTVPLVLEALTRTGGLWVREASPSMLPLIRPGEELKLIPLGGRPVVRGALIACERDGRLVVHRVISSNGSGVVAKGDALSSMDPRVSWDRVVARVVALRAADGRVSDLEAFPWPLVNRLLGDVAILAGWVSPEPSGHVALRVLRQWGWRVLRVPFYLARLVLR